MTKQTKKKSHYETLEVSSTASKDEIKKAYRKKAKTLHPDLATGDKQEMQALSIAYKVLYNEDSRRFYDETGMDSTNAVDEQAKRMMIDCFVNAMSSNAEDVLGKAKTLCKEQQRQRELEIQQLKAELRKAEKRKGKVIRKTEGEDFYSMLVEQSIAHLTEGIEETQKIEKVWIRAMEMLEEYESLEAKEEAVDRTDLIRQVGSFYRLFGTSGI